MALGITASMLSIPIGIFTSSCVLMIIHSKVTDSINTTGISNYVLNLNMRSICINLFPIFIICGCLSLLIILMSNKTIRIFEVFGKFINSSIAIVLVLCIIEYLAKWRLQFNRHYCWKNKMN